MTTGLTKRRIEAVKDGVDILQVCDLIGASGLRRAGERLRGQCPLCGNGKRSEAFSVSAQQGLFYCWACQKGGDLIRLVELYESMPLGMAVAYLGEHFNIELPARPQSWFKKQDRQARNRARIQQERKEVYKRRLFRAYMVPVLDSIPDPAEREKETKIAWARWDKLSFDFIPMMKAEYAAESGGGGGND